MFEMSSQEGYILKEISTHDNELILLIDDQPENLHYLRMLLKNYRIVSSLNATEGIKIAKRQRPDLILLDIMMPGIDGLEACRMLKADEETADIPIIFVTARVMLDDVITGFGLGANDYITKPYESGELLARVKTHLDLRKAKKKIMAEFDRVNKLNDEKNEFINIAAHDLRNPLKVIQGFTRLITRNYESLSDENIKEFLDDISSATDNMLFIINDVLMMNDLDEGNYDLVEQDFDLTELLAVLESEFRDKAEEKNINLLVEDSFRNKTVNNDFLKTKKLLEHLIANALNYSLPHTTVILRLEAASEKQVNKGFYARITISDEGPGISKEEMPHIFDKFCKISNKPTNNEPSSGLGLAISKSLSDILCYKLKCKTEINKGTDFSIYLPKQRECENHK